VRDTLEGGDVENGLIKSVFDENRHSPKKPSRSSKSGSLKKLNGEVSPKKRKRLSPTNLSKKYESPSKKSVKQDEASDCDSDMPLAELQNCISDDDDDDIVLAQLNNAAKRLKKSHSLTKGLENRATTKAKSIKLNGTASSSATVTDDDDDDITLAVIKRKKTDGKLQKKSTKPSFNKVSPKKKVQKTNFSGLVIEQMTTFCIVLVL